MERMEQEVKMRDKEAAINEKLQKLPIEWSCTIRVKKQVVFSCLSIAVACTLASTIEFFLLRAYLPSLILLPMQAVTGSAIGLITVLLMKKK